MDSGLYGVDNISNVQANHELHHEDSQEARQTENPVPDQAQQPSNPSPSAIKRGIYNLQLHGSRISLISCHHFPLEDLIQAFIEEHNAEQPVDSVVVKSAVYGKKLKLPHHEFVLFELGHSRDPNVRNHVVLDRNQLDGVNVLSSVQQSNSAIARDEFRFSCDGNRDKLLARCNLSPYEAIETIEFPTGNLLPFYELATIALVTSHQRDHYHLLEANCYWFAGLVWEQVLEMYPDAKHEVLRDGSRGKFAGLVGYTLDELERDEVGARTQAMLTEMKTFITGVQRVCEASDSTRWDYIPKSSWTKDHSQVVSNDYSAEEVVENNRHKHMRTYFLLELLSSERTYASDLASIRDILLPLARGKSFPLGEGSPKSPMHNTSPMSAQDLKVVFRNIEEISAFADQLNKRLEVALGSVVPGGTGDDRVGEVFCELAPRMTPMYLKYITRHPAAVARYTQLSTNPTPAMAQYLTTTKSMTTSTTDAQDIPSLIIKPLQRLPKYPLILQTILEHTPESLNHPGRTALIIAKEETEQVVRQVNKGKRRWKLLRAVLELAKSPLGRKRRTTKPHGSTNASETDQYLLALEKRAEELAENALGAVTTGTIAENPDLKSQTGPPTNSDSVCSIATKVNDEHFLGMGRLSKGNPPLITTIKSQILTLTDWTVIQDIMNGDVEYILLASELKKTAEFLAPQMDSPHFNALSESIKETVDSIADNFKEIEAERRKLIRHRDLLETQLSNEKTHGCLMLQIQVEVLILAIKAEEDKLIDSLRPSQSALYGSNPQGVIRQHCAKDTRIQVLNELDSWSEHSSSRLMWINGMAGTGKTTIAYSFAKTLHGRQRPTASFFCSRVDPECRDVRRIIPTIAHQLANISPEFRRQLGNLLREDPSLAGLNDIPSQFTNLLKAPFRGVGRWSKDIVVLIDALDECDELGQVGSFLDELKKCIEELPLKFLVTSRPEARIRHRMQPVHGPELAKPIICLHEIDELSVQTDIKLYLKQELGFMQLPDKKLEVLTRQCGSLFIYAATSVRYINPIDGSFPSYKRLFNVLRLGDPSSSLTPKALKTPNVYEEMDRLYTLVVNNALDGDLSKDEKSKVRTVLWTVLCAKEPISIKTIAALCGLGKGANDLSFALERLRSVIYAPQTSGLASVLHSSFPDFMFDKERSKELLCDPSKHNHTMARQCFGLMQKLRFNICNLGSSYMPDRDAIAQSQVEDAIEPALSYACHHWAEHLARTTYSYLRDGLADFLFRRLLFWMEVLSLKGSIAIGGDQLLLVISWLLSIGGEDDLITLAEDARNFVMSFAANPVSISTPHIYTSLLPLCPPSSAVFKCYRDRFQRLIEPDHRVTQLREVSALASWKHDSVLSVAYSPDGTEIAFGCMDGTVGVRASRGGASIFSSPGDEAHQGPVRTMAFAPSNEQLGVHTYLASGSDDGTIRTWNIHTADRSLLTLRSVCRLDTLLGKIRSIAFLPNGNIASGSSDGTVCIWDPSGPNGKLLKGPLHGHTEAIWSVACSPDGKYVASGSDDHTIRFWHPKTGQQVLQTLTAQTDDINSIAFSPDGKLLASGSSDRTICIWNIPQGTLALPPFQAHSSKVNRVIFSPDGNLLASTSLDRSIRVWDPRDGNLIGGPFKGHIGPIYSIAFSPDSTRIISGSPDGTIQLWDPKRSALGDKSLDYHTNGVVSVAFSPDGHYMASCSYDATLRVWDVSNKNSPVPVGDPFRGHAGAVMSLAFSCDGTQIVTGSTDGTARVWDIQHRTEPTIFREHKGRVRSVTFAPNGSFILSAGGDTMIRMWSPTTGTSISDPLAGHTDEIKSVAISPDGTSIASGSADKTVRVWDTGADNAPAPRVLEGHTGKVWSVAYSADGSKLASSSSDGTIRLWDLRDGSSIGDPIIHKENEMIPSVAFSPAGNYIAWGADDWTICLWDSDKGGYVSKPFEGHRDTVWSVAFSPDGTHIASGSHDGTIRIWDIQKRTPWVDGDDDVNADWVLERDGWMKRGKDLLLWVPYEVARSLLTPHCCSVISSCGSLRLDLRDTSLGDQWRSCFVQPE